MAFGQGMTNRIGGKVIDSLVEADLIIGLVLDVDYKFASSSSSWP
jgi:hypothetical protein